MYYKEKKPYCSLMKPRVCVLLLIGSAEIPNFLDDVECDVIIAMAERKSMRDNPKTTYNGGLYFDDPESTFINWDYNKDGFLDPEEVS